MATIQGRMNHESGIPLGGLGTGSVEVRPDGYFHEWQIFNLGRWAPKQPEGLSAEGPKVPPGALAFFVRTAQPGGPPLTRRLGLREDQHDLYSFPWLKSVRKIKFTGQFPVARLRYRDDALPVAVEALAFSPFIPHAAQTSGTPGFHVAFRVKNCSKKPVVVSLLSTLQNPLAHDAAERRLTNAVTHAGGVTCLTLRTAAETGCQATRGSLALSVAGGEASYIAGEYPKYFEGFVPWGTDGKELTYGRAHESFLYDFRETGRLPNADADRAPNELLRLSDDEIAALAPQARKALLAQLKRHAFVLGLWRRVETVEPEGLKTDVGLRVFLREVRERLNLLAGKDRQAQGWGAAALCATQKLKPGEEKEIRFTFSWHFPNHFSALGPVLGHRYENWFADAEAVNRFLTASYGEHRAKTVAFADALFDTNLDPELADAWAGQLTTLTKCTWWTKNGDFAVWEGLGCCGFHTTDITYQGSFNILALFPELQKGQMELGARFQRPDGRVHHFFTPDLSQVDNGFDRVDMNQQFVLLAARDYLWTGDRAYLQRLWPHILKAMDNTAQLDADGDGLPDHDTRRNTYDNWNFFGTPSYIASLWLSALLAAARLADDLGEKALAARWRELLAKGVASFEKRLWNGKYYSLWVDRDARDECCMTDQLDGEWFTALTGLGHALPAKRILAALRAVMKHNFSAEDGLINASYPPGVKPRFATHRNVQALAPWTGIEYSIASMLLDFGLTAAGVAVVKNIHARHLEAGRFWNHVECGDHYYRAMASWAVLLAATGFKVDVPRQSLTFAPRLKRTNCRAPWFSATAWGRFEQTARRFVLRCAEGELRFKELRLRLPGRKFSARVNDTKLAVRCARQDGLAVLTWPEPVVLRAGDALTVG